MKDKFRLESFRPIRAVLPGNLSPKNSPLTDASHPPPPRYLSHVPLLASAPLRRDAPRPEQQNGHVSNPANADGSSTVARLDR